MKDNFEMKDKRCDMMNFIGIDLAWTRKNETGICVINEYGEIVFYESEVFSDEHIAEIVQRFSKCGAVVGIDAPLIIKNETGSRRAEGLVMRDRINGKRLSLFNSNRDYMMKVFKCIRGEEICSRIMQGDNKFKITWKLNEKGTGDYVLFETFPTGIALGLFPEEEVIKYKIKNRIPFETTKENMINMMDRLKRLKIHGVHIKNLDKIYVDGEIVSKLNKKQFKNLEDKVDAFLCAYAAYFHYKNPNSTRVYGDEEEGFIVIPVYEGEKTGE